MMQTEFEFFSCRNCGAGTKGFSPNSLCHSCAAARVTRRSKFEPHFGFIVQEIKKGHGLPAICEANDWSYGAVASFLATKRANGVDVPPLLTRCKCRLCEERFLHKSSLCGWCSKECRRRWYTLQDLERHARSRAIISGVSVESLDYLEVYKEQNGCCRWCGTHQDIFGRVFKAGHMIAESGGVTFDHRKPISCGGGHTRGNVQMLCKRCHHWKTSCDNRHKGDAGYDGAYAEVSTSVNGGPWQYGWK